MPTFFQASPFSANGVITLTTDFGLTDPYVGVMKGVILARHPAAQLLDLTHHIPAFQPDVAGFWLARTWRYFPVGTVHLAVVDPGVGTERAMVLLETGGHVFVAPDNGLLDRVFQSASQSQWRTFHLTDLAHLQLPMPSRTFHGRDIFAPLVAEIAANRQRPELLGSVGKPASIADKLIIGAGQIVCADHYGNLITDIEADCLAEFKQPVLLICGLPIALYPSYGFAAKGELIGLVNSWGTLEIAEAHGNAQQRLQAHAGEPVRVVESIQGL